MLITTFQVRLADKEAPKGFREGYIGTVVGEDLMQTEQGPLKGYLVIWNTVDEETGEIGPSNKPAPTLELASTLRGHVDPDHWDEDLDEDEDETGLTEPGVDAGGAEPTLN